MANYYSIMSKRFKDYQPNQLYLLPQSMEEWLPKGHIVYFINDMVDQLDLSAIYDDYKGTRGYPPYAPVIMVKVWLYAFSCGICSSRQVERALHEYVPFRVLAANQAPDY
jgi:transposase